jgi:hypothetical protein
VTRTTTCGETPIVVPRPSMAQKTPWSVILLQRTEKALRWLSKQLVKQLRSSSTTSPPTPNAPCHYAIALA